MHGVRIAFAVGWSAFWLYWLIAAASARRERGRIQWSREFGIRAVIVLVVIGLVRIGAFRHHTGSAGPLREGIGLAVFAAGLTFAIWARLHIGRNWGPPMTQRDDPELVTSGPYRFVRHPIYSGILLAGVGTAVGLDWRWLLAVLLAGIYFVYSATVEERFMAGQLPDRYAAYKAATKMLIPFVF